MKKFYSLFIAFLTFVLVGFSAQAETPRFEGVVGLNFSTLDKSGIKFRPGFHVGFRASYDIPQVTQGFYVNAATLVSFRGFKIDSISFNPFYLDIPIHAGYKYDMDERFALFIEAGPYFGIGLFGKAAGQNLFSDEVGFKRMDIGLGLRGGTTLNQKLSISLGSDFGFIKVSDDIPFKPRNIYVSVGYKL